MQWIELTVITTTEAADIVANALEDCGSYGASVKDPADLEAMQRPEGFWDMIDESVYADFGDTVRVTGFFRQDASLGDSFSNVKTKLNWLKSLDLGGIDLGTLEVTMGELNEQDWANNWRKYYKPTRVGNDFIIKPTWEEYEKKENDLIIHMDPGMAFGTGTHETTAMCLELCERYVKEGDDIIDVGCGTAILAIAAMLKGAKHSIAVDIDQLAVDCAIENLELNKMSDKVIVKCADLLSGTEDSCDVMFANIVADIIVMLSPDVPARLKKGGRFICSGIIREREDEVREALLAIGMQELETRRRGEWVAMCWEMM